MTPQERFELRQAIDQTRRAQIEAQGGYLKVEADAAGLEEFTRAEKRRIYNRQNKAAWRARKKAEKLAAEKRALQQELYRVRQSRDLWYMRATGLPAHLGRGARKVSA